MTFLVFHVVIRWTNSTAIAAPVTTNNAVDITKWLPFTLSILPFTATSSSSDASACSTSSCSSPMTLSSTTSPSPTSSSSSWRSS